MADSNFVDYVRFCRSGHGGPGSRHFRREKFAPKAIDGGDGGRGGHVILRGNAGMAASAPKMQSIYMPEAWWIAGGASQGPRSSSRGGLILDVPLGTVADARPAKSSK